MKFNMNKVLYKEDGKITKLALWTGIGIILLIVYVGCGAFIASLQEGMPLRAK